MPEVLTIYGIEIHQNNMFPFEFRWDACDVSTRTEIKIPSGEWCHGAIIPKPNFDKIEPLPLQFAPEIESESVYSKRLTNFIFFSMGTQIFK